MQTKRLLKTGLAWMSFLGAALSISGPSVWADSPFCELAASPILPLASESVSTPSPEELLERLAESYRGLLEFGGEAFRPDPASMEQLFALVPNGDQRSVALNESLSKLSDWVFFEAGELGLTNERILERLRQEVSDVRQKAEIEIRRTQEAAEELAQVELFMRTLTPPGHQTQDDLGQPLFLDEGKALAVLAERSSVTVWETDPREAHPVAQTFGPTSLSVSDATVDRLNDPDHILICQKGSRFCEAWNWRTQQQVRAYELNAPIHSKYRPVLSPNRKFVAAPNEYKEKIGFGVLDLGSGQLLGGVETDGLQEVIDLQWSPDGKRLAVISVGADKIYHAHVYQLQSRPRGSSFELKRTFVARLHSSAGRVWFGRKKNQLVMSGVSELSLIRMKGEREFETVWSQSRSAASYWSVYRRDQNQIVEFNWGQSPVVRSATTGRELWMPDSGQWTTRKMMVSPSGRFLVFSAENGDGVQIWDLNTRTLFHRLEGSHGTRFAFSDDDHQLAVVGQEGVQLWNLNVLDENE